MVLLLPICLQAGVVHASPARNPSPSLSGWVGALQANAGQVGIQVVALPAGRIILEFQPHTPLVPASLNKVLTSYAALRKLGPYHHFLTEVWTLPAPQDGAIRGDLWVKGLGDPFLPLEKAWILAHKVRQQGVRVVEGSVYVDNGYFQPPTETICLDGKCDRPYNPVLAATAVDFNTLTFKLRPGPQMGGPVLIETFPPGDYALVDNQATTSRVHGGQSTIHLESQNVTPERRERFVVTGQLPREMEDGVEIRQNVADPAAFFARSFKALLGQVGIEVRGPGIGDGRIPAAARKLNEYESMPLGDMLYGLNRYSNNFMAEMLLRSLGAAILGAPGTEAKGLAVIRQTLLEMGIPSREVELDSGSGLSRTSRISPHALCTVLTAAYQDFSLAPEFLSSLASIGQEGTLRRRLPHLREQVMIRGKTGSLRDVVGFAGYVSGPATGVHAVVILLNEVQRPDPARKTIDRLLSQLAGTPLKGD
jgi:serine-type D-Ala-D-Ala carboxypeptidase/endopeptidase (penicillin-binding protein 4)